MTEKKTKATEVVQRVRGHKLLGEVPINDRVKRALDAYTDELSNLIELLYDDKIDVTQKNVILNAVLVAAAACYTVECPPKQVMLACMEFFCRQLEQQWTMNKAIRERAEIEKAGKVLQ